MPNRLIDATSPYLLQHADNPVDWHEWGEEPFAIANATDRPVLLSVGYAACHWCHVMAHESFEDEATAEYMNEHFVNVKVDREERPDIDRIYMDAVQAMSGHGGWPMTVFLTPTGQPFYAGTYFPKEPRGHHPTFMQVLTGINGAWHEQREQIEQQAASLTEAVGRRLPTVDHPIDTTVVGQAIGSLHESFDSENGGFGGAPKFPQAPTLELLLRVASIGLDPAVRDAALRMLTKTLDTMAAGGIYDHLYGGFARYAVDAVWLVPHFEKMLYDNALLARLYTHAWALTGDAEYRRIATETLDYLVGEMRHPGGGILSAEDADSEGVEGKFAVWAADEFAAVTGPHADLMAAIYGVTPDGNFEGSNILHRFRPIADIAAEFGISVAEVRAQRADGDARLVAQRRSRVAPQVDDKVVLAWNGLAIRAFAEAATRLDRAEYLVVAVGIAQFVFEHMSDDSGRLMRAWRDGRVSGPAFCDDYAAFCLGLFALYEATGDELWFDHAVTVSDSMIDLFATATHEGFYATGTDVPDLITRPINLMDNPTPSDNSLAAEALTVRAAFTAEPHLQAHIDGVVRTASMLLERHPTAIGHLLAVLAVSPLRQLAVVTPDGGDATELLDVYWDQYRPHFVIASGSPQDTKVALLRGRAAEDGVATAYVCENFSCRLPTKSPVELRALLDTTPDEMQGPIQRST